MASNSLLELAKKVIRKAGEIGLEEAGKYVCGPAWPYAKKMLSPVVKELEKRYPKLLLKVPEEAQKAAEALSRDNSLQKLLQSGFAQLESGQEEILAALARQNDTLVRIGRAIHDGFDEAGKQTDAAFSNISREISALKFEISTLRDIHGGTASVPTSVSQLSDAEIDSQATACQWDAMQWVEGGKPDIATRRLNEARTLLEAGLQREPGNANFLVAFGFVEKTQAQVAQLLGDHEEYVSALAESGKYFAEVLRSDPMNVGALNGMANIYYSSGDLDRAIEAGTLAVRSDPNYGAAAWDLALSLEAKVNVAGPNRDLVDNLRSVYRRLETLIPEQPKAFMATDLSYVQERLSALEHL